MDKHILELKDDRLTADSAPHCTLNAILGTESASVMITNSAGEVLRLESWTFTRTKRPFQEIAGELREVLRDERIFEWSFQQRHGVLFHPNITLVPRRLFQHNALPDYFKLLLHSTDYAFAYEELPELDVYLVSATEKSQLKLFQELFPMQTRAGHLAVPLFWYIRSLAGLSDHTVFVNLRHHVAQVMVLERQNLLFYNSFSFEAPSDLLYYVLLAYDQFRLDPNEVPLTVAGAILKDSELYRMLYRFVREIRFAVPPVQVHMPENPDSVPGHCHLDLFCLKTI